MALGKGLNSLIPQQKTRKKIRLETGHGDSERLWHIPLSEIAPNPAQPRKQFNHADLEDLVVSIKKHGIMQPITVSERDDGGYEIVAGERRFRASQIAEMPTIPAIVRQVNEQEKLELALIENIQRQQLNAIEEAFAFQRLMEEFGLTQQEVAEQVGKSRSVIANTVRLLGLPDDIQRALIDGKISMGKARALLSLNTEKEQMAMFQRLTGSDITVRDVEHAVQRSRASRKGSVRRDPNVIAQEEMLEQRFGTKVRITQKGDRGTITIEYHSREELKRLLGELT
ncbi:MAG: hypothetical protein COU35_04275 [Candidatus Magasanikbacteria bacterium CG10_big_fil_rev_8_21_14_0_10_47_10]|uniref:HTH cro/C1-type domain-containing protein n=1 Tax=Candidatus Magasanikbacteria bacterium CG10_big_fil_rev_8_21_14_0_10_47_10 TaxID=1974652 RepID=A0A2H0TPF0_9BACT|nr:MAG: hypothetical protein COU35_04275 [Candidatus Magasanikbacteria bacterium CG10_big_fil_rev_8_21_14_0_10_47_10]